MPLDRFTKKVSEMAPLLLGKILLRRLRGDWIGGMICETEAYSQEEPASHCHRGQNSRNASMFAEPGTIYVYRSYGVHWCLNIKCGVKGYGEGVLIRALKPMFGIDHMRHLRLMTDQDESMLCNGPGKLCQAMGIDGRLDGKLIGSGELFLFESCDRKPPVVTGRRIGISRGLDLMWRFGLKQHPCLSRPFKD
ncbi:MAG: DNA-3-methyladenine glycosylase [Oligoflexales bacterium]|nr:DNA-3-methyladenine glycosylase [Oligoflexales bacterium]